MTALDNNPLTKNLLNPTRFKFSILKTPNVDYFVQTVAIPGISCESIPTPTPMLALPQPGEHMTFDPLQITFKIDEQLQNYLELYSWLTGLSAPFSPKQFADLEAIPEYTGKGMFSDISVIVLDGNQVATHEFIFIHCWPIALAPSAPFTSTMENDIDFLMCSATFRYLRFIVVKLT